MGEVGVSSFDQSGDSGPHGARRGIYSPASERTPRAPTWPTQLETHSGEGTPTLSQWSRGRRTAGPSGACFPRCPPALRPEGRPLTVAMTTEAFTPHRAGSSHLGVKQRSPG